MKAWMLAAGAAMTLASAAADARKLDLSKPEDALAANRKMACSLKDGTPTVFHWSGRVYSRTSGERDRHVFNVEGMNIRQCAAVTDPAKGTGYRMVSREIMLYLDPKTGEVLRQWNNPWTGEAVQVFHVANDPVNMRAPIFARNDKGEPFTFDGRFDGGKVFMATEVPLFYDNPLAGDYQDFVGNKYHAMEIFDFIADEKTLLDSTKLTAEPSVAWVRIAQWLPWMKMRGREGIMVTNAIGRMLKGYGELPKVLKDEIATNYPEYAAPPPLDDKRPNETSWTYFKKKADAMRAEGKK
jgi:hypothetical protein